MALNSLEIKAVIGSLYRDSVAAGKPFLEVLHERLDSINSDNQGYTITAFSSNNTSSTLSRSAHSTSDWITALQRIEDAYEDVILCLGEDADMPLVISRLRRYFPRVTRVQTDYSKRFAGQ